MQDDVMLAHAIRHLCDALKAMGGDIPRDWDDHKKDCMYAL